MPSFFMFNTNPDSMFDFYIHENIAKAETLPASFYREDSVFEALKKRVFRHSWQWQGCAQELFPVDDYVQPMSFLEGFIEEPVFLKKNSENEEVNCFSNVCTHRGNLIFHNECRSKRIACGYHGRQWRKDGQLKFMPEFNDVEDFPRACDHLTKYPSAKLGSHVFTSLNPAFSIDAVFDKMKERIGFLPLEQFKYDATHSKDYLINCHWALYCDNYLEGFHIPFVHDDLNEVLDYGSYQTELFDNGSLQIGYSKGGEDVFEFPEGHPDQGKHVAAYYYWIFPNMMFNFYPWGLSINIVKPLSKNKTRVVFRSFVWDSSKLSDGAGAVLDKVEREDEFVVEGVHKGLQSHTYQTGRFSPTREQGVHHFHRLLAKHLKKEA